MLYSERVRCVYFRLRELAASPEIHACFMASRAVGRFFGSGFIKRRTKSCQSPHTLHHYKHGYVVTLQYRIICLQFNAQYSTYDYSLKGYIFLRDLRIAGDAVPQCGLEVVAAFENVAVAFLLIGRVERLVAAQPAVRNGKLLFPTVHRVHDCSTV